ncbi:DNA glycosylase AlkZ-like family protein, partial [Microbacterium sp.]|uniref:DNA glycosylase AlkZ-like family protein n=1 Tax=Microbacterium sp. TaxID=51671 RepID=UPI003F9A75D1
ALTRAELFALLDGAGIDPTGQRGGHAVQNLALRGLICQGPVVPRPGGASREQLFVLTEEHIGSSATPADPAAEMFVRYIVGHGPATAEDFAWWAGVTLSVARAAASIPDDRIDEIDDGVFLACTRPRRSPRAASVLALGSFEEYYIPYRDRTVACPPEHFAAIGPGKNGMVRPIIINDGVVVGTWRQSTAVGRHADAPVPELLTPDAVSGDEMAAALARYAAFITG